MPTPNRKLRFQAKSSTTLLNETTSLGLTTHEPAPLKPITENDLPPESQKLLGIRCNDGDCVSEQPLCPQDPRVTCQLIPTDPSKTKWMKEWQLSPWLIRNAKKGYLLMSPGTQGGVIGSLLGQLRPAQHYTHMGIMTKDEIEVRHATVCQEWFEDHPNGSLFGKPQPTDGYEPDAVRFGWPGTITQSVENAYMASLDENYGPAAVWAADKEKNYVIHALSFSPVLINTEMDAVKQGRMKTLYPLLVRPCNELQSIDVLDALERIADEVIKIRGHYRYYSYSKADISEDSRWYATNQKMLEDWMPNPDDRCQPVVSVKQTIPVVCSTIIWAAVQRINAVHNGPKIILDTRQFERNITSLPECKKFYESENDKGTPDFSSGYNGLYKYSKEERIDAATTLHDYLEDLVKKKVIENVPGWVKSLGGGLTTIGEILAIINLPVGAIAALLGLSITNVNKIVEFLTDIPSDVANQITNAFASDYCDTSAKDSEQWNTPGEGVSVSPDNIINYWSAPNPGLGHPKEFLYGLYGFNVRAKPQSPRWELKHIHAWAVSAGPGKVSGQVVFQGRGINNALVKLCCSKTFSRREDQFLKRQAIDGFFTMDVPAGDYLLKASFDDPQGAYLKGEIEVSIPFQGNPFFTIELQAPPESNRIIVVKGKMDLVKRVIVGHDHWSHPVFETNPIYLGPYGKPNVPGTPEDSLGKAGVTSTTQGIETYGNAKVEVTAEWQPDFSIKVKWYAALLNNDGEIERHENVEDFVIGRNGSQGWHVYLENGGLEGHAEATIDFIIFNNQED